VDGAKSAVDALLAGQKVALTSREAKGQLIAFPERAQAKTYAQISYAKTVAPIIQAKCATCHQPGGIGPMPLNTYEQIKGFSPMIREVIRTHRMPPYLADETVGAFQDDDRLTPTQMKTLVHWIDAGSPRGAGEDPLQKIKFQAPDWPLGKPDVVLNIPAVKVPASGVLDYTHPVVPMTLPEGRWMKATTFRVSDRQVVHHILSGTVGVDHTGDTFAESQWGASLGGYGPGRGSNIQPLDTGVWVPAAGGVGFQNHYPPYG
jgi:mono/diheme cytochrome c family protein